MTIHQFNDGREVGELLARSQTSDVVDAQLVILALRISDSILTSDTEDLTALTSALPTNRPKTHAHNVPIEVAARTLRSRPYVTTSRRSQWC